MCSRLRVIVLALAQQVEFGGKFDQHLLTMAALAFGFFGIEAEHVAAAAFALADHDLLDLEIVCHRLVTARTVSTSTSISFILRIGTARI